MGFVVGGLSKEREWYSIGLTRRRLEGAMPRKGETRPKGRFLSPKKSKERGGIDSGGFRLKEKGHPPRGDDKCLQLAEKNHRQLYTRASREDRCSGAADTSAGSRSWQKKLNGTNEGDVGAVDFHDRGLHPYGRGADHPGLRRRGELTKLTDAASIGVRMLWLKNSLMFHGDHQGSGGILEKRMTNESSFAGRGRQNKKTRTHLET